MICAGSVDANRSKRKARIRKNGNDLRTLHFTDCVQCCNQLRILLERSFPISKIMHPICVDLRHGTSVYSSS